MLTTSDKAWVAAAVAYLGQLASSTFGWPQLSPELIALITGAAVWWMPNLLPKAAPTAETKP